MSLGRVDLARQVARARAARVLTVEGRVREVRGVLVGVEGLSAAVGAELQVDLGARSLRLEVLGFREGMALTAPLGDTAGVAPGMRVRPCATGSAAPVGEGLLGRVVDAFGRPLDGAALGAMEARAELRASPPSPLRRRPVDEPLATGVRALDALLPLGLGQRVGLFAGTGVGKSTLLGMLCRHAVADVIVVGLIGERGREVGDFVRGALGPEGLRRAVVVAATSDQPPLVRARGALYATAVAEHFRARGLRVLLVMDSVTRFAMALREATLAAGEPPLTKGYTPSVFAALPSLLERAGTCEGPGAITAVYTVLVEGDDLNDPIADAVRGILDGHIVLSRKLADRGLFPAVDTLRSVSRLACDLCEPWHLDAAATVRGMLAALEDASDLIQLGAYVPGSDPRVDRARSALPAIEALLRQPLDQGVGRAEALRMVREAAECGR
ncbi:MAG: FliI/YscN family ATPase [Deltaproteobacteria bacterium]|nr:FliI/YscN family ATPase [Deltaproteobacteria bacterium]